MTFSKYQEKKNNSSASTSIMKMEWSRLKLSPSSGLKAMLDACTPTPCSSRRANTFDPQPNAILGTRHDAIFMGNLKPGILDYSKKTIKFWTAQAKKPYVNRSSHKISSEYGMNDVKNKIPPAAAAIFAFEKKTLQCQKKEQENAGIKIRKKLMFSRRIVWKNRHAFTQWTRQTSEKIRILSLKDRMLVERRKPGMDWSAWGCCRTPKWPPWIGWTGA